MSGAAVLRTLAVLAAALLLTGLLASTTLFQRVELWLGDAQQRLAAREMHFPKTLVVDIDEASLRRLDPYLGAWPYRRDIFALVLDYLGEFGAELVCFDILMSERRPGDQQLAEALGRSPATVIAAVTLAQGPAIEPLPVHRLGRLAWSLPAGLPRESWNEMQWPTVADAAGALGIASLWPDVDGSVRRIPLFHRVQGIDLPALAVAVTVGGSARPAVAYLPGERAVAVAGHSWPIDGDGRATLNYPSNTPAIKSLPFHALALAALGAAPPPFAAGALRGTTVIVGSTALQSDAVHTPRGLLPGVYLLALAHENLAGDLLLRPTNAAVTALLLSVALLAPLAWSLRRPARPALLAAAVALGALLAWGSNLALLRTGLQQSPLLAALLALLLYAAGQMALIGATELRRRRHAEHQMRIAAAVFDASREGIIVTDADNRIVSVNPAFTAITGYAADEVLGHDPKMLNSGQHDPAFFQALWQSIAATGSWQGEIRNRRKDGSIYPQWLAIDTVRAADGSVDKRIAVFTDLSAHEAATERIDFLAHFDALTGLPNRTLLRDRVNVALAAAARSGAPATLMFLDLDRFRHIVESLGHDVGDRILRELARRLGGLIGDAGTVSRHGGDEFVLLLPASGADAAAHLATRILAAVARPLTVDEHELSLTASIGIALFPADGADYEALLRSADSALHRAKQAGRNAFRFYAAEMHSGASELLQMESSLRHAVARDELRLHYQPQVEAGSGRLVGLEALVRWQHPQRGLVSPAQFIPVAEECGLIGEIGDWVLRTALDQMRVWADAGLAPVPVAVNLSLAQFRQPTLCDRLIDALQASGLAAGLLELELTESIAMEDIAHTVGSIDRIRLLGVGLAIDDFGTGYSSLAYLKRFAVHKIKIDQSFVRNLTADNNDASIVRAIIGLAHNLGFRVIAEGVESAGQLGLLRQWGCDEIQGFYFSRPLPAEAIVDILQARILRPATEKP